MKQILGIIPARKNSKGIPGKNLKLFNGKPLIAWSIEEALKSKYINRLIVSTEDTEIAEISKFYGAEVPFLRAKELADDITSTADVVLNCLDQLQYSQGYQSDYIVLLQCTSPNRTYKHIDMALEKMVENENISDSLLSVCEAEHSPFWMKVINNDFLEDFISHNRKDYHNRQVLPAIYRLNGAIYIIKPDSLKKNKDFQTLNSIPFIMDHPDSIDIDCEISFKLAEIFHGRD